MLTHGIPWQAVLGEAFLRVMIFIVVMLLSLLSGFFAWYSIFTAIFLLVGFSIIILLLPLLLNLSRSYFWIVFAMLITHITITVLSFSLHYKSSGLIGPNGALSLSYYDALYFSITTFTTLGYGDFRPLADHRLTTSLEALAGMISMAIGVSFIWLWCQENMVPKEMAFFDGNRRHKKSMSISRIRIRTITGEERTLKNWVLPPKKGESYYYDDERKEWVQISEDTILPENALVIGRALDDKNA
ncbi:MAG: ion channel [Syntrophales bacterium]|nr:ion channel [Syntrophales bacterium]